MRRREFIGLLGSAAAGMVLSWLQAARAHQPEQTRRVGVLMAYTQDDAEAQKYVSVFRDALKEFGWVEGRNLAMIEQWPGSELAAIQQAAKDLIKQEPDVILSSSTPTTAALLRENRTIPIVFAIVSDPIGSGFVKTFAEPGGNATGFTDLDATMGGKWLELLKRIVPDVHDAAFLFNPMTASYANFYMPSFVSAGASLGIVAHATPVANDEDIERMVAAQSGSLHSGIVVMTDSFTSSHRDVIIRLTAQYRVPAIYPYRFFAQGGGLLAYGNNRIEPFRGAALYVNRILHGEKVSDLPVQAPTQFELVVNLKTARALGISVPPTLLALADEVIE